LLVFIF